MVQRQTIIHRKKQKPTGGKLGRWLWIFLFILFLGSVAYAVLFSGFLRISRIEIRGVQRASEEDIRENIENSLTGKFVSVLDRNNILLVRRSALAQKVISLDRRIRSVNVTRKLPDTLIVSITERTPTLIYCGPGAPCVMLDEDGLAFDAADPDAEEAQKEDILVLTDESGQTINDGDQVASGELLSSLKAIRTRLSEDLGLPIDRRIETPALLSDDIRVTTRENWKILFSLDIPLDKEMEVLKLALENKIDASRRNDLEYVDLRADNKVFYKFKGEEQNDAEVQPDENAKDKSEVKGDTDDKKKKKKK